MATSKSTELAAVDKTPVLPPGHLNDVGHNAVRLPVPSWVKNQLIVCPSFALDNTGATVMLAVMVTVNTLDRAESTASDEAAKVSEDGLVCAAPSTVITPDENKLSTELEPAVNLPIAALVALSPVMLALVATILVELSVVMVELVAVSVVVVMLVAVN